MKNFGFDRWAFTTALKEVRASWGSMFVLMGSLAIAIGSIVAVNSLRDNLNKQVDAESKSLLGADLSIGANSPLPDSLYLADIEALIAIQERAEEVSFGSMAYAPSSGYSRLSRIKAIKGNMPFYGEFETEPVDALARFRNGEGILADPSLFIQLAIKPGDKLKLGRSTFEVLGSIGKLSGSSPSFSVLGPRIMMPYAALEATNLIVQGSRVEYTSFYKFKDSDRVIPAELDSLRRDLRKNLESYRVDVDTYLSQRRQVGRALDNIFNFLNLVGFGAIILGMIGVSVTINRFLKSKYNAIAVLRCLGASPDRAKAVYWIQLLIFGFIGSLIGVFSGILLQYGLPLLAERITNSEIVFSLSFNAISLGMVTGLATSLIFAWAPLQALGTVSPLQAIRADATGTMIIPLKSKIIAYSLIAVLTFSLAYALVNELSLAVFAVLGLVTAVGILTAIGKAMMWLAFKVRLGSLPYSLKQGLANLYRPNNQTLTTVVTVGTGVLIMGVLILSQQSLLSLLELDKQQDAANLVFLDIQNDQRDAAIGVLNQYGLPVIQDVPIVTMRLSTINGKTTSALKEDSTFKGEKWALNREYRSSYRDSLSNGEILTEGDWVSNWDFTNQPVPVSAELGVMESLDISIGDTLVWDVQGVPLASVVSSSREVDWQQISPNFFMIFPKGVLDGAPQIRVMVSKADDAKMRADVQTAMVQAVPNASTLDVTAILSEVRSLLNKLSAILQVMGALSILVGLIVLAGSIRSTQQMRMAESLLLRTLGAESATIKKIISTEYAALASLSVLAGLVLALGSSFAINLWFFEINAFTGWSPLIYGGLFIILGVVSLGYLGTLKLLKVPPLTMLRKLNLR